MDLVLRLSYAPQRRFIHTIGAMVLLSWRTILAALSPPYDGPKFVDQFRPGDRPGQEPGRPAVLHNTRNPAQVPTGFSNAPCRVQGPFSWNGLSRYFPHVTEHHCPGGNRSGGISQ
jgi:hypothetical protein